VIAKAIDRRRSIWRKWDENRERLLKSALPCTRTNVLATPRFGTRAVRGLRSRFAALARRRVRARAAGRENSLGWQDRPSARIGIPDADIGPGLQISQGVDDAAAELPVLWPGPVRPVLSRAFWRKDQESGKLPACAGIAAANYRRHAITSKDPSRTRSARCHRRGRGNGGRANRARSRRRGPADRRPQRREREVLDGLVMCRPNK
jgi:hypothetical protein